MRKVSDSIIKAAMQVAGASLAALSVAMLTQPPKPPEQIAILSEPDGAIV